MDTPISGVRHIKSISAAGRTENGSHTPSLRKDTPNELQMNE